jgi:hydrogenase-4 transcriptional activator
VLRETNGIVAGPRGAAVRLGVKRTTLLSRMRKLGINAADVVAAPSDPPITQARSIAV